MNREQMGTAALRWVSERIPQARVHAFTVSFYKQMLLDRGEQEKRAPQGCGCCG